MITCPAGGKVDIKDWGEQEIKKPFMLGETEVTQELFEAVTGYNNSKIKYLRNPVENVDWYDCLDFCNKLSDYFGLGHCYKLDQGLIFVAGANGFRLPKEWEWVIAALAGTNNKYAGTNDEESLGSVAWFSDNSNRNIPPIPHQALLDLFDISETSDVKTPHSVAQKIPNEWGFYDMTGNIWEWCENSEQPNDNNDGSIDRVIRGGCYNTSAWVSRTANRKSVSVDTRSVIGFRVARSLT
jgi:sulfatase modifying factor 1